MGWKNSIFLQFLIQIKLQNLNSLKFFERSKIQIQSSSNCLPT